MKRHLSALLILAVVATAHPARAGGIDGKWGLDAPVVFPIQSEFSLIRGTANGAWIVDVSLNATRDRRGEQDPSVNPDIHYGSDYVSWEAGPRLRRYARPDASLSPYTDVFLHAQYGRTGYGRRNESAPASSLSYATRQFGAILGAGLGVEMFTKWGLSAAIGTNVASLRWLSIRDNGRFVADNNLEGSSFTVELGFRPQVYVRGYW